MSDMEGVLIFIGLVIGVYGLAFLVNSVFKSKKKQEGK